MKLPAFFKKPIGAAALSAVFPGLGQAAAGDRHRGAIVAIPALATTAAVLVLAVFGRHALLDNATNQQWLTSLMILDVVALLYHLWAIADAYLLAMRLQPRLPRGSRLGRPKGPALRWTGVMAITVLVSGTLFAHGAIAVEDASLQGAARCLNSPIPCWLLNNGVASEPSQAALAGNVGDTGLPPVDTGSPGTGGTPSGHFSPQPSLPAPIVPAMQTTQNSANWNADHQLNLLLVGMDSAPGRTDTLTDTMILLHVNTLTGQSAMFGIARNLYCMPLPAGIGVHFPNPPSKYACPPGRFTSPIGVNGEANALFYDAAFVHPDWYPGFPLSACAGKSGSDLTSCTLGQNWGRGTFALEQAVGALTGLAVDGTVIINLPGFAKLVDDLGGIDINVPGYSPSVPGSGTVSDYPCGPAGSWAAAWHAGGLGNKVCPLIHDGYTTSDSSGAVVAQMRADAAKTGGLETIVWQQGAAIAFTIQPGQQHMDGEWALAYARSREYSSDYNRMARQRFVLQTIRNNVTPCSLLPRLIDPNGILKDLGQLFWTNMPTDGSSLTTLAGLAQHVTGSSVISWSLDPGTLGSPSSTTMITTAGWSQAQYIVAHGLDKAPASSSGTGSGGGGGGGGFGC